MVTADVGASRGAARLVVLLLVHIRADGWAHSADPATGVCRAGPRGAGGRVGS